MSAGRALGSPVKTAGLRSHGEDPPTNHSGAPRPWGPRRSAAGSTPNLCEAVELLDQLHLLAPPGEVSARRIMIPKLISLPGEGSGSAADASQSSEARTIPSKKGSPCFYLLQDARGSARPGVLGPGFPASEVHGLSAPWSSQAAPVPWPSLCRLLVYYWDKRVTQNCKNDLKIHFKTARRKDPGLDDEPFGAALEVRDGDLSESESSTEAIRHRSSSPKSPPPPRGLPAMSAAHPDARHRPPAETCSQGPLWKHTWRTGRTQIRLPRVPRPLHSPINVRMIA